jgi:hypothetical protein
MTTTPKKRATGIDITLGTLFAPFRPAGRKKPPQARDDALLWSWRCCSSSRHRAEKSFHQILLDRSESSWTRPWRICRPNETTNAHRRRGYAPHEISHNAIAALCYCRTGLARATQMAIEKYASGTDDRGKRLVDEVWPRPVVSFRMHRVEGDHGHHCNFIKPQRQPERQQQPSELGAIWKKGQSRRGSIRRSGIYWWQHFAIIIAILLSSVSSSLFVTHCSSGTGRAV